MSDTTMLNRADKFVADLEIDKIFKQLLHSCSEEAPYVRLLAVETCVEHELSLGNFGHAVELLEYKSELMKQIEEEAGIMFAETAFTELFTRIDALSDQYRQAKQDKDRKPSAHIPTPILIEEERPFFFGRSKSRHKW